MPPMDQHYRVGEALDHDYKKTPYVGLIRYYDQGLAPDHPDREVWTDSAIVLTAPEGFWAVQIGDLRERELWVASGAFLRLGPKLQPENLTLRVGHENEALMQFMIDSVQRASGLIVKDTTAQS